MGIFRGWMHSGVKADSLRLPGNEADWSGAIVRVEETLPVVQALPEQLTQLAQDAASLNAMRERCAKLWRRFGVNWDVNDVYKTLHGCLTKIQTK